MFCPMAASNVSSVENSYPAANASSVILRSIPKPAMFLSVNSVVKTSLGKKA